MRLDVYNDQLAEIQLMLDAAKQRKMNILIKGERGIGKALQQHYDPARNVDFPIDFEILRIEWVLLRKNFPQHLKKSATILILENLQFLMSGKLTIINNRL
jgi:hypothetical protein